MTSAVSRPRATDNDRTVRRHVDIAAAFDAEERPTRPAVRALVPLDAVPVLADLSSDVDLSDLAKQLLRRVNGRAPTMEIVTGNTASPGQCASELAALARIGLVRLLPPILDEGALPLEIDLTMLRGLAAAAGHWAPETIADARFAQTRLVSCQLPPASLHRSTSRGTANRTGQLGGEPRTSANSADCRPRCPSAAPPIRMSSPHARPRGCDHRHSYLVISLFARLFLDRAPLPSARPRGHASRPRPPGLVKPSRTWAPALWHSSANRYGAPTLGRRSGRCYRSIRHGGRSVRHQPSFAGPELQSCTTTAANRLCR